MKLPKWLAKMIPVETRVPFNDFNQESSAIAHTLDADKLGSILRSAESGDMEDLFALYRDIICGHAHAMGEFCKRKLAVVGDDAVFKPHREKDPADESVATATQEQCEALPNWLDVQLHLLDSTLWPLSMVEKIYRPSDRPGYMYELAELRPVPYRLIDFTDGYLMLWDVDERGQRLATRHRPDPARYIIHRGHPLVSIPDTWGGPMRAVTFWYLFSVMDRHWWARFLDRYGAPFMEASYDESDDAARLTLARAFQAATKLFGIAVPKSVQLKMHQASLAGSSDAFKQFHTVANEEMSKVIIGQTGSASAQNTGLGSGVSEQHEQVRQDIRQFDAKRLAHTFRTQLFVPLRRINAWTGSAPNLTWGGESAEDMAITAEVITALTDAGFDFGEGATDILSRRFGLPLERRAPTQPAPGLSLAATSLNLPAPTRSDRLRAANEKIAASGAEEFASAMGESLGPIRHILATSSSMDDFERRLRTEFPALPSRKAAEILAATMISNAANGILAMPSAS